MTTNQGYVYILTNPSFKEDWVKIGKSARPVDVRSKELDNTAVPLPFDIYATLKTVKYDQIEKAIHKQLDLIAPDRRIRKGREFFNVAPDKALEIFKIVATMLDDYEIAIYKDNKPYDYITPDKNDGNTHFFFCKNVRGEGKGWYDETDKRFTLCAGSRLAKESVKSCRIPKNERDLKISCKDEGAYYKLLKDITLSPSTASGIVFGSSTNGWVVWKDADGKTLDEVYRKKKI